MTARDIRLSTSNSYGVKGEGFEQVHLHPSLVCKVAILHPAVSCTQYSRECHMILIIPQKKKERTNSQLFLQTFALSWSTLPLNSTSIDILLGPSQINGPFLQTQILPHPVCSNFGPKPQNDKIHTSLVPPTAAYVKTHVTPLA